MTALTAAAVHASAATGQWPWWALVALWLASLVGGLALACLLLTPVWALLAWRDRRFQARVWALGEADKQLLVEAARTQFAAREAMKGFGSR